QTKKNNGQTIVSYADDGEKFGVWAHTFKHCYEEKWLANFFKTLQDAGSNGWLKITTFSEVLDNVKPRGKAYLPDCSYREMTEWALPAEYAIAYEDTIKHSDKCAPAGFIIQPGGYWRNFRVKYPEINIMYSKMLEVSRKVAALKGKDKKLATSELYKGQGNCAYWHGIFGGFYLPHLRHAIYEHLIEAEAITGKMQSIIASDFDCDGYDEIKLSNQELNCYLKPSQGGTIYEFDIAKKRFNPLATLGRRREAYHHKILEAQRTDSNQTSSIHDLVVSKTKGLENLLYYDNYLRQSLIDHFIPKDTTLDNFSKCHYEEQGDFISGEYQVKSRSKSVTLWRDGTSRQGEKTSPLRVEKTVSFSGNLSLLIEYAITNIGQERLTTDFAPEFNLSMLAGNAYDRYYYDSARKNIGPLITVGEAKDQKMFGIKDEYQKIDIGFTLDKPADIWFFPVQTVSQSEGGFELIYQSSVILPRWELNLEPGRKWQTQIIKKVVFL
ncbi:MAG: DUF1926 domain-containing protein, partial [Planctomycetes bacterium]|nr:DUF1926 domain-containing protein [Planctomycetota bacterium]